ncbi:MAG TPA: SH3 domain-containing protein [Pyrinomonadaceae bacterium]|jgi:hypothetical protein
MLRVLQNQNIGIVIAFFIFFALCFTASVESAQTKNSAKTKATPAKKNARQTPTPNKKTQAKATPTPKKSTDKKGKTNSSSKSQPQTASKNKAADKSNQSSSKSSAKTNQKTSAKQTKDSKTKDSKTKDSNSRQNSKNTKPDSVRNAKNTKSSNSKSDNSKNKADSNKSSRTSSGNTREKTSDRRYEPTGNTSKQATSTSRTTPAKSNSEVLNELPQIIVTDVSARVRSKAQPNAPELSRIRLGTILKVTEKNPAWYKVQYTAGGKTANGWISANSVNDLNSGAREELYRQIVDRNYKAEMDFASASEMVDFLTQVGSELGGSNASAELELKRLLALQTALKKIPSGQGERSPYKEFLKAHEKSVIYSDPAAEWYVVSNLFWDLHKKYAKTTAADQIAWEAAENSLPGECEGYVNCYLFSERMTNGEYLRLHPNGKKAPQALANLTRFLSSVVDDLEKKTSFTGPTDVTDRADFYNLLAELRTIVSRLPLIEKEKTLQQLKQIAEAYR